MTRHDCQRAHPRHHRKCRSFDWSRGGRYNVMRMVKNVCRVRRDLLWNWNVEDLELDPAKLIPESLQSWAWSIVVCTSTGVFDLS
jgi:hypothetical protein